ncbi:MAG: hypothetical protein EAZ97_01940 [Bacteroidetes bacterium]|nr:MAG: hypothetical protein EAZ97_01940 [Bacteroidota bacterium]
MTEDLLKDYIRQCMQQNGGQLSANDRNALRLEAEKVNIPLFRFDELVAEIGKSLLPPDEKSVPVIAEKPVEKETTPPAKKTTPAPTGKPNFPWIAVAIVAVLLLGAAGGFWYYHQNQEKKRLQEEALAIKNNKIANLEELRTIYQGDISGAVIRIVITEISTDPGQVRFKYNIVGRNSEQNEGSINEEVKEMNFEKFGELNRIEGASPNLGEATFEKKNGKYFISAKDGSWKLESVK